LAKQNSTFKTITYGDRNSRDVIYANRIATALNSDHHFFEFSGGSWVLDFVDHHLDLTEGHHSWIHSHGISTLEDVRGLIDVNLTGWALGGILGGHWYDPFLDNAIDDLAFECYLFNFYCQKHTWPGLTEAEEANLYSEKLREKINGLAFDSLRLEIQKLQHFSRNNRAQFFHLNRNRRLTQNFVIFNSHYIENRFPVHSYKFFDFIYSLPPNYKANRRLQKDVIEYIDPSLALIPQAKDGLLFTRRRGRRIAHHIITRLKQRTNRHIAPIFKDPLSLYADYEYWLRNELRDWGEELLLGEQTINRDIFNPDFLSSLWSRLQAGLELNIIGKVASIMTYEMMLRKFYDDDEVQ
jgi:asparagine synthase (glutamine-hydrolysing)